MLRPLILIVLLAPALLAGIPGGELFPSDYVASPCSAPEKTCDSFKQSQFADIAALRGFDIGQEWIDAHWERITTALRPVCAKAAACFATPGNTHLFCNDLLREEVYATCSIYPQDSKDRKLCNLFIRVWWVGHDLKSKPAWTEMQSCATTAAPAGAAERTLLYRVVPETMDADYRGEFRVIAVDSETRVPVQARLIIDSREPVFSTDSIDGKPTTFYRVPWNGKLLRVPSAQQHHDVVPPTVRIEAPGYRTETFVLPVEIPVMTVTMSPPPAKLRRGANTVTITAVDAKTGAPIEARVMGGSRILGKANEPFTLTLAPGAKRPEIWVTNLFDRYSDVVVAPAGK